MQSTAPARPTGVTIITRGFRPRLATSLIAVGFAALGMPVGGLLVPLSAVAAECDVGDNSGDGTTPDLVTCGTGPFTGIEESFAGADVTNMELQSTQVTDTGLDVVSTGTGAVNVEVLTHPDGIYPAPVITNDTDNDGAVHMTSTQAPISFTLTNGTVTGTFGQSEGIFMSSSGAGGVTAVTAVGTVVNSNDDDAIDLSTSGGGAINATIAGTVTAGTNGGDVGIGAVTTGGGDITVTVRDTASVTTAGNGIETQALGATGNINVTVNGQLASKPGDLADQANASQNENGIYSVNAGSGTTVITLEDDPNLSTAEAGITSGTGVNDHGIYARGTGATTGNITVNARGEITAGGDGVRVRVENAGSTAAINVEATDDIRSLQGNGIDTATVGNGNTQITVTQTATIETTLNGVNAVTSGTGRLDVDVDGDVTSTTAAGNGVRALSTSTGVVDVHVQANSLIDSVGNGINAEINAASAAELRVQLDGAIDSETDDGIQTLHTGTGISNIVVNGTIRAGNSNNLTDAGIQANATGGGGISIKTGSNSAIRGTGVGIEARATGGTGTVGVSVAGLVDTNTREVLVETVANGTNVMATIDIEAGGRVNTESGTADNLVLDANGGATVVNNDGTILGRVDLTDSNDTFNNNSANTWTFVGVTDFEDGDDTLNNNLANPDTGARIVNAVTAGTSETAEYISLEQFNNYGLVTLQDQVAGQAFNADRAYTDGDYEGFGGTIAVDAVINANGTGDADRFIIGGDADGSTFVAVNNVNAGFGGLTDLIPVIEIVGNQGNFELANGPIDVGLYSYDLVNVDADDIDAGLMVDGLQGTDPEPTNVWALEGYVDASVFNLAALPGIATNTWATTAGGWIDRSGDLREYFRDGSGSDVGLWGRLIGAMGERTGTEEFETGQGNWVEFDTGYTEELWAGELGADFAIHLDGSTLVLGAFGGYVSNQIGFASGELASLEGPVAGLYVDWIGDQGTYVSALGKVDLLSLSYNFGAQGDIGSEATTWGGVLEAGHRFNVGGFFIEPVGSIAYASNGIETITVGDDTVEFDGESLRGKVGGRIGATFTTGTATISPYASAFIGNEFIGTSTADVETTGAEDRNFDGVFGELGGGINLSDVGGTGLTGFIEGHVTLTEDYTGGVAKGGLRGQF